MNDYEILGIKPGANERELKKAYRQLAKLNHPDRFADPAKKREQERKMARINAAYEAILNGQGKEGPEKTSREPATDNDTTLYKKGVEIYGRLNIPVALKYGSKEYNIAMVKEKMNLANWAKDFFEKLLRDFPESDWAYDSGERHAEIEKYLPLLETSLEFLENHVIGSTKKGTPTWKKKP